MSAMDTERSAQGTAPPPPDFVEQPKFRFARPGRESRRLPYILLFPAVFVLVTVLLYPLLQVFLLAFKNENKLRYLLNPGLVHYIGFAGFYKVFHDPQFWQVIERSFYFTAEVVAISMVLALGLAALLNRVSTWARILLVVVMMFVWSVPTLVTGTVFRWLFSNQYGVINYLLYKVGFKSYRYHDWFANPTQGLYVVVAISVIWGALPFLAITLHAGMTQVPTDLLEAAKIDGANPLQSFRNVVLPVLRPLLGLCAALSFIWDFQVFNQIYMLRQASPEPGYWTIGIYIYEKAFVNSHYSDGAVVSLTMIVLMVAVLILYIRQMLRIGDAD